MEALQDTGTQAQLWMWAGIGIGLLLGGAAGGIAAWLGDARALTLGLAVFQLCMGLPAATGALRLAQVAVQVQEQTVPARGRLLGYEAESASEAQRRKRPGGRPAQRPRVAFTTPEGQRLEFLGLGGSRSGLAVGAEVPVRYVAARPQEALVADFQTLWGPAWALGAFGTFALSGAAVFLLGMAGSGRVAAEAPGVPSRPMTKSERRAARKLVQPAAKPAPLSPAVPPARDPLSRGLHLASVGLLLLAVPLPVMWMRARPMEVVAVVFAAITAGLVGLIVAQALARRAATGGEPARWPLIPALLALNFGYFALGAWLFTRA
ncbi:MAG: DUF3592 domain-containing protein [Rubrivivax sp.]|nr:DUF3592 domain-containing protein [Rubrivivax sp.]